LKRKKGIGRKPYLSTCISPCPVDSLSAGDSPTGTDVFSRAFLTLYGLTGIPSACTNEVPNRRFNLAPTM
jgi:hypothetical protein